MSRTTLARSAVVPLLIAVIAVGALALGTADATPAPAKGVHHVEKSTIPVELGPATVVVP